MAQKRGKYVFDPEAARREAHARMAAERARLAEMEAEMEAYRARKEAEAREAEARETKALEAVAHGAKMITSGSSDIWEDESEHFMIGSHGGTGWSVRVEDWREFYPDARLIPWYWKGGAETAKLEWIRRKAQPALVNVRDTKGAKISVRWDGQARLIIEARRPDFVSYRVGYIDNSRLVRGTDWRISNELFVAVAEALLTAGVIEGIA